MAEPQNILSSSLKRVLEQRKDLSREDARLLLDYILDVDDFGSEIRVAALLGAQVIAEYERIGTSDARSKPRALKT